MSPLFAELTLIEGVKLNLDDLIQGRSWSEPLTAHGHKTHQPKRELTLNITINQRAQKTSKTSIQYTLTSDRSYYFHSKFFLCVVVKSCPSDSLNCLEELILSTCGLRNALCSKHLVTGHFVVCRTSGQRQACLTGFSAHSNLLTVYWDFKHSVHLPHLGEKVECGEERREAGRMV